MSEYLRLKALAIEADRRGDRDTASAAMGKMRQLKSVYDAYGVDMELAESGPKAMSDSEARQQWIKENPWKARGEAFAAGAGDLGRNLAGMLLPDRVADAIGVGDEDIRRKRAENAELEEAHGGFYTAGQIVPTLITAGVGTGGSVLGRAIAMNPIKSAMIQGGVLGAASAGPDDRWEGAALGAAAAGIGGKVLQKAGQALSSGLAPQSEAFKKYVAAQKAIDPNFDARAPIQIAGPREGRGAGISKFYDEVVAQTPFSRTALDSQRSAFQANALKAPVNAAYGKNAGAVLEEVMPGGKFSEVGGANNLQKALETGNKLLKEQYDTATLPPLRQAFAAAKDNIDDVTKTVQPKLQKAMAQLAKQQTKVADLNAKLEALGPMMQQADEAAEAARPVYNQAQTALKKSRLALRKLEADLAKKAATAKFAADQSGTNYAAKNAQRTASLLTKAQKAVDDARAAYTAAKKASIAAAKVANPASARSEQLISEEAELLQALKNAERSFKGASTRMGTVQTEADAAIAAARSAAARQGSVLHAARLNPGVPQQARPFHNALNEAAARSQKGNPTFQAIANAADEVTPEGRVLKQAMLGAQDLASKTNQRTTVVGRTLLSGLMRTAGITAAPLTRLMATQGFQSFLLGNTAWQNAINRAYSSGQGMGARIALSQAMRAYLATGAGDTTASAAKEIRDALDQLEEES